MSDALRPSVHIPDLSQHPASSLFPVPRQPLRLERVQEAGEEDGHGLGAVPEAVDVRAHAGEDQVGERVVAAEAGEDVRAALKSKYLDKILFCAKTYEKESRIGL